MTKPIDIGRGFEQRITKRLNDWWRSQGKKGSFERRGLGKKGLPDIVCPEGSTLGWPLSLKAEKWGLEDIINRRGKVHRWIDELVNHCEDWESGYLVTAYKRKVLMITNCKMNNVEPLFMFIDYYGNEWEAFHLTEFLDETARKLS